MAKGKGPAGPSDKLKEAIRARMIAAVTEIWSQCGIFARSVRVEVTFADGRKIAQERRMRE